MQAATLRLVSRVLGLGPSPGFINAPAANPTAVIGFFPRPAGPISWNAARRCGARSRIIPDSSPWHNPRHLETKAICRPGRPCVDCLPGSPAALVATHDHDEAAAVPTAFLPERTAYDDDARDRHCRATIAETPAIGDVSPRNMVLVASEAPRHHDGLRRRTGGRMRPAVAGPKGLNCTRIAAQVVGRFGRSGAGGRIAPGRRQPAVRRADRSGTPPGRGLARAPSGHPGADGAGSSNRREPGGRRRGDGRPPDRRRRGRRPALARRRQRAGARCRTWPIRPPGPIGALRPPRELIVHPAFGQVARRFHYIQMNEREARALGAGAVDLGILAQRLRRLQGDPGEFAITAFRRHGAAAGRTVPGGRSSRSEAWTRRSPGPIFCMAWVVARRFRRAGAAQALAYANAVVAAAVKPAR